MESSELDISALKRQISLEKEALEKLSVEIEEKRSQSQEVYVETVSVRTDKDGYYTFPALPLFDEEQPVKPGRTRETFVQPEPYRYRIDQIFNNTVYKEIEYGLKRMKLPKEERERRIMDAAVLTGMDKFLDQNPYDFPLSVRKFVTIASVIASGCEVLIFDEPTAGQDLDGLERLSRLIRELTARGKALIDLFPFPVAGVKVLALGEEEILGGFHGV